MADLPFPAVKPEEKKPEEPKKGGGLFAAKPKPQAVDPSKKIADLTNMVNDIGRRLRVLEERYNNLQKKAQLNEENALANFKKFSASLSTFHDDINDFRKHIKMDDERTELIIKELKLCAKKEDVAVLQRYINLWDPVKFVSRDEVDKIIDEKLDEKNQKV